VNTTFRFEFTAINSGKFFTMYIQKLKQKAKISAADQKPELDAGDPPSNRSRLTAFLSPCFNRLVLSTPRI
jgi:hypothetical protein